MFLLVNPYIYDFAAYDMWMMPLGLLHLGSILKNQGYEVKLIDLLCVDYDPQQFGVKRKSTGDGKLPSMVVDKPEPLMGIAKKYRRYGVPEEVFLKEIENLPEKPEAIFVTSKMTYWYPGVSYTISILRKSFPETKIVLGGTYAKILTEHAKSHSGADIVFAGDLEDTRLLSEFTGIKINCSCNRQNYYTMDLSLLPSVRFLPLLSSLGCPFRCTYCASEKLFPKFVKFSPERVVEEILIFNDKFKVNDITIFDDAFLVNKEHAKAILMGLLRAGVKFRIHTPNALHARYIDREFAELMKESGFYTLRLGLESSNPAFQNDSGGKVFNDEFTTAVKNLHSAGFKPEEIGVYVMCGLPFQKKDEVLNTLNFVVESGAKPKLVEYSPVPGTELFEKARACSPFDLNEPLYHNNSILPCQWEGFTYNDYMELKNFTQKIQTA
jgi:radical SAM superfamily enzyme YgiQ (UPF0313 family)